MKSFRKFWLGSALPCLLALALPLPAPAWDGSLHGAPPDSAVLCLLQEISGAWCRLFPVNGKEVEGVVTVQAGGLTIKAWAQTGLNVNDSRRQDFFPWADIDSLSFARGKKEKPVPLQAGDLAHRPDPSLLQLIQALGKNNYRVSLKDGDSYKGPIEVRQSGLLLTKLHRFVPWDDIAGLKAAKNMSAVTKTVIIGAATCVALFLLFLELESGA
ncbi:hypothetical protein LLH00_07045 [bacterium]|nr:hypothetical protein [bacterium]